MKQKVGIVTLFGNINYGNRLQNYALQQILRGEGFEVETLCCARSALKEALKKAQFMAKAAAGDQFARRRLRMDRFNKEHIPVRKVYSRSGQYPDSLAKEYDYFVVGSDQVWNPEIRYKDRYSFFLRFARENQRVCVSPSIGIERFPDRCCSEYAEYLRQFNYLSCREADGAKEIERVSGKRCEHLLDPTLVIQDEKWRALASPLEIKGKYLFMFFLGDVESATRSAIENYAAAHGCTVIDMSDPGSAYYAAGPEEFIWLIDHAEMVFTDSFHVTAFSINLKTPFYVYDRHEKNESSNHMSSRMRSLTALFSLESRYVGTNFSAFSSDCDFGGADDVLAEERDKFAKYIHKCFFAQNKEKYDG